MRIQVLFGVAITNVVLWSLWYLIQVNQSFTFWNGPLPGFIHNTSPLLDNKARSEIHDVIKGLFHRPFRKQQSEMYFQSSRRLTTDKQNGTRDRILSAVMSSTCRKVSDALIIGYEKCGTFTLKTFLNMHPDIFAPEEERTDKLFSGHVHRAFEKFSGYKKCTPKGMLRLRKMQTSGLPSHVFEVNPNMKLIAIVREPVNRTVSHFLHGVDIGWYGKNETFESVIKRVTANSLFGGHQLITQGMYSLKLKPWLKYFNESSIHIVDGDVFAQNPATQLSKVEKFLGVKPFFTSDRFVYNADKGFYCFRHDNMTKCMADNKGRPHPKTDPYTVKLLKEFFWLQNEEFFALFGKRYPWNDNI